MKRLSYRGMSRCKLFVSENKIFNCFRKLIYFFMLNKFYKRKNHISIKGFHSGNKVKIRGKGNTIILSKYTVLKKCNIRIIGNNCKIIIDDGSILNKVSLSCRDDNSVIWIKNNADIGPNTKIISMEGNNIVIGENSLISYDVEIRNSDSHSIINADGIRINKGNHIEIGNNVWIAGGAIILKGSNIGNNCVIGAHSVYTLKEAKNNSIFVGNPAKIIKDDIKEWNKDRL